MKKLILALCLFVPFFSHAETKTVEYVDLSRYLGDWYEVASIPQSFSKGCFCTRARYGLRDDAKISVYNTCNKGSISGDLSEANGVARVSDTKTNAKLRVSFFWPFSGDYWIIGLDQDYRYAVVSNRTGTTLWILSRTPVLDSTLLTEALTTATNNGIDITKLHYTEQEGCNYPEPPAIR